MATDKPAAGPVLSYAGDAAGVPSVPGIPCRDLDAGDLSRLAGDSFVRRRYARTANDLAAFLVKTGVFTKAASARPAADVSPSADGKE